MSMRTLIEFNHDFAYRIEDNPKDFVKNLAYYLGNGNKQTEEYLRLEYGMTFFGKRHHSSPYEIVYDGLKHQYPYPRVEAVNTFQTLTPKPKKKQPKKPWYGVKKHMYIEGQFCTYYLRNRNGYTYLRIFLAEQPKEVRDYDTINKAIKEKFPRAISTMAYASPISGFIYYNINPKVSY